MSTTRVRNHIFDPSWYVTTYPDVRIFPGPAFEHFRRYGFLEGRHPCNLSAVIEDLCGTDASNALISDFAFLGIDVLAEQVNTPGDRVVALQGD